MKILITGGAGYIGSFMVKAAIDKDYEVVVADSLERGLKESIDAKAKLIVGELRDRKFVESLFAESKFDAVAHFAGYISMAESVINPYLYFDNNINASLNVIESMVRHGVNNFIFSSTAGVYGNPIETPIAENHPKNPTNPYGESKLMVEKILSWYGKIYGLNFVSLRYFNASGASADGQMGEHHSPESHLIPNTINAILNKTQLTLYGNDYPTPDGTCIRDYIHVTDLAKAHVLALKALSKGKASRIYNLGNGVGYSVKEVIEIAKQVTNKEIKTINVKRRAGDPPVLVASSEKIIKELGWKPKFGDLKTIIKTAWLWHSRHIKGFKE